MHPSRHPVCNSGNTFEARSDLRWCVSGFMLFDCGAAAHWSLEPRLDCRGLGAAGFNWIVNGSRVQDWPGWGRRQMGCRTRPCRMEWVFEWAEKRGIGQRGKGGMARGPLHGDDQIPRPPLSRCTLQMREVLEKGQPLSLSVPLLGLNVLSAWPLSYSTCKATSVSQIKMIKMLLKKLSFLTKCMQEFIISK